MKVPEAQIREMLAGSAPTDFMVWPDNVETVKAYTHLNTEFRISHSGRLIGLDWPQVETKLRLLKIGITAEMVNGLEIMAAAEMEVING